MPRDQNPIFLGTVPTHNKRSSLPERVYNQMKASSKGGLGCGLYLGKEEWVVGSGSVGA